ncbi:MAG: DUF4115 domain-containing protein [Ahniella sp.]|nr:DUF4115 domain-containing protein [Ahniella sp.]
MSRRKSRRPGKPTDSIQSLHVQAELPVAMAALDDRSDAAPTDACSEQAPVAVAEPVKLVHAAPPSTMSVVVKDEDTTLGQRLRRARQNLEWSREDMAQKLRLPVARILDIENDRFDTLGATVYARSYLLRYAKLVDVPELVVRRQFAETEEPTAVSRGSLDIAPSRRVQRVSHLAKYAVLTAVIMVPALMSVFNRSTPVPVQVRSLETAELSASQALPAPSTTAQAEAFAASFEPEAASSVPPAEPSDAPKQAEAAETYRVPTTPPPSTLAASMAPMMQNRPGLAAGEHEVVLSAREDSWMELIEVGGRRIDQGLLRAGESRRYVTRVPIRVRIGNSGGVDLQADGSPVSLAALARKNVANLELFGSSEMPASRLESAVPVETP